MEVSCGKPVSNWVPIQMSKTKYAGNGIKKKPTNTCTRTRG
jgi:hypothetical protein